MDARLGKMNGAGCLAGLLSVFLIASAGCTSTVKTRAQTEAAFRAGQQQALRQAEASRNAITFTGPVLNPLIPWAEDLTLGQAIGAAGWNAKGDPRLIILTRGNEVITMKPEQALEAAQEPVFPGDQFDMLP